MEQERTNGDGMEEGGAAHNGNGNGDERAHAVPEPSVPPIDPATIESWKRWTFAQIDNGRSADDVVAELISSGWEPEPAAALVDEMNRRAEAMWTRSSLAEDRPSRLAGRGAAPPSMGRFSFVGSLANLFIGIYRLLAPDAEEQEFLQNRKPPRDPSDRRNPPDQKL